MNYFIVPTVCLLGMSGYMKYKLDFKGVLDDVGDYKRETKLMEWNNVVQQIEKELNWRNNYREFCRGKGWKFLKDSCQIIRKAAEGEDWEWIQQIHGSTLEILTRISEVDRYNVRLAQSGFIGDLFYVMNNPKKFDVLKRKRAFRSLLNILDNPETHADFFQWKEALLMIPKLEDPICDYFYTIMIGRFLTHYRTRRFVEDDVRLHEGLLFILQHTKDPFTETVGKFAHRKGGQFDAPWMNVEERLVREDCKGIILGYAFSGILLGVATAMGLSWKKRYTGFQQVNTLLKKGFISGLYSTLFGTSLIYYRSMQSKERKEKPWLNEIELKWNNSANFYVASLIIFGIGALALSHSLPFVSANYAFAILINQAFPDNNSYNCRFKLPEWAQRVLWYKGHYASREHLNDDEL